MVKREREKIIATNKKARMEYHIDETYEAGIVLLGTEVKAIREGRVNLKDSYAAIKNGEMFLYDMHISPYTYGNRYNHDPLRTRKLLLHKHEIRRLYGKTKERGYTLIPLRLYFKNGKVKVELGVAKGKKLYDRREEIKKRDERRLLEREMHFRKY